MNLKKIGAVVGTAALLTVGAVVGIAGPASAHTGDITASASCNTSTGEYDVTYTLHWANIPNNVQTADYVKSTTGDETFKGNWSESSFSDWRVVGTAVSKSPATLTWTGHLPSSTTGAPWTYAVTKWSDDDVVKSDAQITGLTGNCGASTIQKCSSPLAGILSTNLDANGWDFSDTRTAGHNTYVPNGLKVTTDDATSESKAAGSHAVGPVPLSQAGEPSLVLGTASGVLPGLQLGIDRDGDGHWDGNLVNEGDIYGHGNWWTNKDGFGVASGDGYEGLGTLQEYLAANPKAEIVSAGYSLGSGVKGSAIIRSLTVGCQTFTFDYATQQGAVATANIATQATCTEPGTESFTIDHATWSEAVHNEDGSWSRTATATGDYAFPDGATTKTVTYRLPSADTALCAAPDLTGSVAVGTCVANAPWIDYDVKMTDIDNQSTSQVVHLILDDGKGHTENITLGTLSGGELKGRALWPGASVAADGVTPTGWPGWQQNADGTWSETTGNFAWTRAITNARIEVNPSLTVALAYPAATPQCDAQPPVTPALAPADDATSTPTPSPAGTTPTDADASGSLADTGSNEVMGLTVGGIAVLGGAILGIIAYLRRRTRNAQ